ncbi:proline-rich protein HaeIII subfamily 1-like [Oncorhynchus keta]|uniref:proline-rich protein HaeIII subfamily 1-like n=1 Tax=Oncorhynchus keta TaxID=8018 RepID=UPI00227B194D|nr:proline-rich protein HaeIII subfamily 1-like [Oncorhynchus keta]
MRLADYGGVAVGVLLTLITFLGAGLIVSIKRKTLLKLLFTNKKNPMDKLRSVGPNRSSGPSHRDFPRGQPQAQTQTPPQRQKHSIFKPPPQNQHPPGQPYPSHSQRRLPQCSPVHLSHPVPLSPTSAPGPGQPRPPTPPPHRGLPPHGPGQPRPPAPPPHRALPPPGQGHAHSHTQAPPRGASFRSEPPEHNSCRMVLVRQCVCGGALSEDGLTLFDIVPE